MNLQITQKLSVYVKREFKGHIHISSYMTLRLSEDPKVHETFNVFDSLKDRKNFVIAFSGGKDSTALSILFYEWLLSRNQKGKHVFFVHNDTESEFDVLEDYAIKFLHEICAKINETGNTCIEYVTRPKGNFYWRSIFLGYVASTTNFRWCIYDLKVSPNKRSLKNLIKKYGDLVLFTGHREDESIARKISIQRNSCGLGTVDCASAFYLKVFMKGVTKVAPIKKWNLEDVWKYLRSKKEEFNIDTLFDVMYKNASSRWGCWHCTVVKIQKSVYNLDEYYFPLEALRILYRTISDLERFRLRKDWGYSKLGALTPKGRAILMYGTKIVENMGIKLYGLDFKVEGTHNLREIMFELDEDIADKEVMIIAKELKSRVNRIVPIGVLRSQRMTKADEEMILQTAENNVALNVLRIHSSRDHFRDLVHSIREMMS